MIKKITAFTLAEVLITLGIIGVVAAMTIPTLMNKTQNKETVTAAKKAYSILSQAYTMAVQENGTPDEWGLTNDGAGFTKQLDMIKPYLKVAKDCSSDSPIVTGCFPAGITYNGLDGNARYGVINDNGHALLLTDGTSIYVSAFIDIDCKGDWGNTLALHNTCSSYTVDVNGFKKPNQSGKDLFVFWLTKYGIVPAGGNGDTGMAYNRCVWADGTYGDGSGCAAWVITNGNVDYLNCPNTLKSGWAGPTKCN